MFKDLQKPSPPKLTPDTRLLNVTLCSKHAQTSHRDLVPVLEKKNVRGAAVNFQVSSLALQLLPELCAPLDPFPALAQGISCDDQDHSVLKMVDPKSSEFHVSHSENRSVPKVAYPNQGKELHSRISARNYSWDCPVLTCTYVGVQYGSCCIPREMDHLFKHPGVTGPSMLKGKMLLGVKITGVCFYQMVCVLVVGGS